MKQSYLNIYEDLLKRSLLIPDIVSKSANKDTAFLSDLNRWLLDTEEVMKKNSIPQCSEVAGLRSKIISASYTSELQVIKKRKFQLSVAASIIYDAQNTVLQVLAPIENRINEARGAIRQLLAVAYQSDMINHETDFTLMVQTLWATFSTHEQLKGMVAQVLVFINKYDALRLLAEEIDLLPESC